MRSQLWFACLALCSALSLAAPQIKIGAIGDSITFGICGGDGGYPTILQGLLGGAYSVKNFGNSGKTQLKYGQPGDSAYWNQTTWPAAQAFNADIYTILLGT
jgi:acyl-CoA thioesterase-1